MMNKLVGTAEIQHRALKLRIYPTKEQEILINKTGRAKRSPQDSQKSSGLLWRLRLRSATRKIHIRPIPEPGTSLVRSSARIRFANSRGHIGLDQSLSHHSSCNFQEAVDVRAGNIVHRLRGSVFLRSLERVVVDVRHNLLELRVNFLARP